MEETKLVIAGATGEQILNEIERWVPANLAAQQQLEQNWAYVGMLLKAVMDEQYWKAVINPDTNAYCGSFREYLAHVQRKGPTQLYAYIATVRELGEYVEENDLTTMGISKAKELAKATKNSGLPPTQSTIQQAKDPEITIPELHHILFGDANPKEAKGQWMDIGGFPVTDDEKLLIQETLTKIWREENISETIPKEIRFKMALVFMCMEKQGG